MSKNGENVRPRLCVLEKGTNGYGFHLHGEKGKTGQFIRLVEPDSPSEFSGLRAGDRLVFVNGESVESESHQQVVSRIRATAGKLELIVVDQETDNLLQKNNLKCLKEYVTEGIPLPTRESDCDDAGEGATAEQPAHIQEKNGKVQAEQERSVNSDKECKRETRPRLCVIKKGAAGYGFNLHSEKSKPGQYIRAVDMCSPAEKAGLLPKDKILQVNGVPVDGKQHAEVVAAIKTGGDETSLLVVDPETDEFFKKCRVSPTQEHLTGPLPEPIANGEVEEKFNGAETKETKVSVSPSPSSASSCASLTSPTTTTPPTEVLDEPVEDAALTLNISLQQAKERAHKKRSNKRAPQMDWSKKNELFSNL